MEGNPVVAVVVVVLFLVLFFGVIVWGRRQQTAHSGAHRAAAARRGWTFGADRDVILGSGYFFVEETVRSRPSTWQIVRDVAVAPRTTRPGPWAVATMQVRRPFAGTRHGRPHQVVLARTGHRVTEPLMFDSGLKAVPEKLSRVIHRAWGRTHVSVGDPDVDARWAVISDRPDKAAAALEGDAVLRRVMADVAIPFPGRGGLAPAAGTIGVPPVFEGSWNLTFEFRDDEVLVAAPGRTAEAREALIDLVDRVVRRLDLG